MFFLSV